MLRSWVLSDRNGMHIPSNFDPVLEKPLLDCNGTRAESRAVLDEALNKHEPVLMNRNDTRAVEAIFGEYFNCCSTERRDVGFFPSADDFLEPETCSFSSVCLHNGSEALSVQEMRVSGAELKR